MERGLRNKIKPVDDACDINIAVDQDYSAEDQKLLSELNRIINLIENPYLWEEINKFDLRLRERLRKEKKK